MQPSQSAMHILQQNEEIHKLTEELNKCNNDKKFVWGLWKKLQKSNPDLNAAIEQVVQREKDQNEQKISSLVNCSDEKDEEIKLLSNKLENSTEELKLTQSKLEAELKKNETLNETILNLKSELLSTKNEIIDYTDIKQAKQILEEEKSRLKENLINTNIENNEKTNEIQDLKYIFNSLDTSNNELRENLRMKEEQNSNLMDSLEKFRSDLQSVSSELSEKITLTTKLHEDFQQQKFELNAKETLLLQLRNENNTIKISLTSIRDELQASNDQNNQLQSNIRNLENTLTKFKTDIKIHKDTITDLNNEINALKLEKDARLLTQANESQAISKKISHSASQLSNKRVGTNGDCDDEKMVSTSDKEDSSRFEILNKLLQARTLELDQIRVTHDRRLQRYQEIRNSNKLLKKQLATYQPDAIVAPVVLETPQRLLNDITGETKNISTEDALEIWRKFQDSQTEIEQLKESNGDLQDQLDISQNEISELNTNLAQLRMCIQQERDNLIVRLSNMRSISCSNIALDSHELLNCKFSSEFKISELEECLRALEQDRKIWREEENNLKINSLRLENEMENAINEIKNKELIICDQKRVISEKVELETIKSNILISVGCQADQFLITVGCQTDQDDEFKCNGNEHKTTVTTRNIGVQTAQYLLVKSYPSLTHSSTQTSLSGANSLATPNNKSAKQETHSSYEVKSLQNRISTLNKQLKVVINTKDQLKRDFDEERIVRIAFSQQVDELQLKLKITRGELELLSKETLMLRQSNIALEEQLQTDNTQKHDDTATQIIQLQSRLRSSIDECTKQATTTNRLKKELNEKKSVCEEMSEIFCKKEKEFRQNLKQKRHLIDDMREEVNKLKQSYSDNKDLISKQACEIKQLNIYNENIQAKNLTYKARIDELLGENKLHIQKLNEYKQNLSTAIQQLKETSDECSRKNNMLKIAQSQINHLSYIFENESSDEEFNLSTSENPGTNATQQNIQKILTDLAEKIWNIVNSSKSNFSISKDILKISYSETLQLAQSNTVNANSLNQTQSTWESTNYNRQIISALKCTPPKFSKVVELILKIINDRI